jgi:hypothetical protein
MAASLVANDAIDAKSFFDAHSEVFATFAKIQPFLAELRKVRREPDFCKHFENVVISAPNAMEILRRRGAAVSRRTSK